MSNTVLALVVSNFDASAHELMDLWAPSEVQPHIALYGSLAAPRLPC